MVTAMATSVAVASAVASVVPMAAMASVVPVTLIVAAGAVLFTLAVALVVAVTLIAIVTLVLAPELPHPALFGRGREALFGGVLPEGGRDAVGQRHGDRLLRCAVPPERNLQILA